MLAVLLTAMLTAADPKVDTPDPAALVRQLGADTRDARDAAGKALVKIGAPAIKALREGLKSSDIEIRKRSKAALELIEVGLYGKGGLYGEARKFDGHSGSVNAVCFSPDGKRVASGDSAGVRVFDVESGKLLAKEESEHRDRVMCVAFSPDGKYLASGSEDRTVVLRKADTLEAVRTFKPAGGDVRAIAFRADSKTLYTATRGGMLHEWDVEKGTFHTRVSTSRQWFAVAPADKAGYFLAAGGGSDGVEVYECAGRKKVGSLEGHAAGVKALSAFAKGAKLLTGSDDMTLRVWDVATKKSLAVLKGHEKEIRAVAIRPDGKIAVSGGLDHHLHVWDVEGGRLIRALRGHDNAIWCVAVSPDGKYAASGSQDATLRLWRLGGE